MSMISKALSAAIGNMKSAPQKNKEEHMSLFEEDEFEPQELTPQEEEELYRLQAMDIDEMDERDKEDLFDLLARKWKWGKQDDDASKDSPQTGFSDQAGSSWKYGTTSWPTGSSSGSSGSGSYVTYEKCRHKATAAFKLESVNYCGGSRFHVEYTAFPKNYLVIRLLGEVDALIAGDETFVKALKHHTIEGSLHRKLFIDWRDYHEPPVGFEFWDELHALAKAEELSHVVVYCEGGHGRTGTFLAAMLVRLTDITPDDAIAAVRKNYCKEAVESESQWEYLDALYQDRHPGWEPPKKEKKKSSSSSPSTATTKETKGETKK